MANCHKILVEFDKRLQLSSTRFASLEKSKKALRKRIRKYFKDSEITPAPKFHSQGSSVIGTSINPINGGYDLDDGIYLIVGKDFDKKPQTVHQWILNAVNGHTKQSPINKNTCVRVVFSDENNPHHIDLPIYYIIEGDDHPHLAHLKHGWVESDPRDFTEWFEEKCDKGGQLKRLVRFVKGWRDFKKVKHPKSFVLTALLATHYIANERDDIALRDTIGAIKTSLEQNFSCLRPTTPVGEELLAEMDETQQDKFINALGSFLETASRAINQRVQSDACIEWKRLFGDRFPVELAEDVVDEAKRWATPPTIRSEARSAAGA